jgi:hypothetical protein
MRAGACVDDGVELCAATAAFGSSGNGRSQRCGETMEDIALLIAAAYWIVAIRCNQPLFKALPAALAGLDPTEVITPHPVSGPRGRPPVARVCAIPS